MDAEPHAGTLVGTSNVLYTPDHSDAGAALAVVLRHRPDIVGLQEWGRRCRGR